MLPKEFLPATQVLLYTHKRIFMSFCFRPQFKGWRRVRINVNHQAFVYEPQFFLKTTHTHAHTHRERENAFNNTHVLPLEQNTKSKKKKPSMDWNHQKILLKDIKRYFLSPPPQILESFGDILLLQFRVEEAVKYVHAIEISIRNIQTLLSL